MRGPGEVREHHDAFQWRRRRHRRRHCKSRNCIAVLDALLRGLLCNVLVCLAVWMSFATHYVSSKIIAITFPVAAFITLDFKHSAANMQLIPLAMLLTGGTGITVSE